jgi:hypothetical protein
MSLILPEALGSIAAAQALTVAPALGESYAGKSAGALALLLMMLADGADARAGRRLALAARADALLAARGVPYAGPEGEGPDARIDRQLGLLGTLLEQTEATEPDIAKGVRDWLADWAENERLLLPPAVPADA